MPFASPWLSDESEQAYPTLDRDLRVDVAVIGGGICGLSTAFHLTKAGKSVAVFEKARIAQGETGYTTAFLTKSLDIPLVALVKRHGEDGARDAWKAGQAAIEMVSEIARQENLPCDFSFCDARVVPSDPAGERLIREEASLARRFGFDAGLEGKVLRLGGEAKFNPVAYARGLAELAVKLGAQVFERSPVSSITHGRELLKTLVTKGGKKIEAEHVVIATHAPDRKLIVRDFKLKSYRTFAIETRLPAGMLDEGIYWDTRKPFHYWRVDGERLILGGEDVFEKPDAIKAHAHLLAFAKTLAPGADFDVEKSWGGQLHETEDGLPIIGTVPGMNGVYVATGFSGNGMTFGTLSAVMIRDAIFERENPWMNLFDPQRFTT